MMVLDHSQCCLVLLLTSFAFGKGQDDTIRPIRHSLPDGLQSVNGSSSDGGCTSRNDIICGNLQDGGTSVLFDNTILPLSGLEGDQWARDLFTVRRLGTDKIVIGFDFGTPVQLRRMELVLFNCRHWSIRVPQIQIWGRPSSDPFPLSDPARGGVEVGSRLVSSVKVNSCEDLYRICLRITSGGQFPVYYIVIPNGVESDWVYLAETIFHKGANSLCDPDTLVTEPVTPLPTTTTPMMHVTSDTGISNATASSTIEPTDATAASTTSSQSGPTTSSSDLDSTATSSQSGLTTTSLPGNEANPASGVDSVTISVIVVIIVLCVVAVVSAVVIIFWVRRQQKKKSIDMKGCMCPTLDCFGTSRDKSQSGGQNKLYDAIVLTPATGQVELSPPGYETIDKSENHKQHSTTAVTEDASTTQQSLEDMYSVIQKPKKTKNTSTTKGAPPPIPPPYTGGDTKKPKGTNKEDKVSLPSPSDNDIVGEMYAVVQKPKKTKNKPIPEDEDAPPMPPHTPADTYAVVNKKPKESKKEGKVPPSSPPDNMGEMYAVVKKAEFESEPPAIPPHTVDALYSC